MIGLSWMRIVVVLTLLAALAAFVWKVRHDGYVSGRNEAIIEFEAQVAKQKAQAAAILEAETVKARATEEGLRKAKDAQEVKDAKATRVIGDLRVQLGRLRDPGAPRCGPGSGAAESPATASSGAGAADGTQAGRLLSESLTGLLRELMFQADTINAAYASCREDALRIRQ